MLSIEKAQEVGLGMQAKPDAKGIRKKMSVKARNVKCFKEHLYKEIRGVVETVFGGATNAGLILTHSKKTHTRRLDTLMSAVRHNLLASLRAWLNNLFCDTLAIKSIFKSRQLALIE